MASLMLGDFRRRKLTKFMTAKQVVAANSTCREAGAVGGARAIVPKIVKRIAQKGDSILDFGAGKNAVHTRALRQSGLHVVAHEIGENVTEGLHDDNAFRHKYAIVFASNVLNVQPSEGEMKKTLGQIMGAVRGGGTAVVNYPQEPRKAPGVSTEQFKAMLSNYGTVEAAGVNAWTIKKGA